MRAAGVALDSVAVVTVERHRVYVDPTTSRPQLEAQREPVGLGDITEAIQDCQTPCEVGVVDSQAQVSMVTGLLPDQRIDTPAATPCRKSPVGEL